METDNEMWQFWLKGASSRTVDEFFNQKYWFESLLNHFVFGAYRMWAIVSLPWAPVSPVQGRGDSAEPQQVAVGTQ